MNVAESTAAIAFFAASLFLPACRTSHVPKELGTPVPPEQRTSAIDAARKFREAFNQGACEAVYAEASEFFRRQSKQDWMNQCTELYQRLGLWRSSDIRSAVTCGSQVICLDETATFQTGSYDLELAWLFGDGRPRLCWWVVEGRGQRTQIPPAIPRNLMDPPLRNQKTKPA
jgi:hypothetical protein